MRLAAALAAVALVGGMGGAWGDASSDYIAKMRVDLAREPGSYVGCVPGGCLRPNMKTPTASQVIDVPVIDVDTACRGKGNDLCVAFEQDAYNAIKAEWNYISRIDREVCFATAMDISQDNQYIFYRAMQKCVEARISAEASIQSATPRKFQP